MLNMHLSPLLPILLLFASSDLAAADTLHVVTHDRVTVVTDNSTGNQPYARWGEFPPKGEPIRKITLHLTLGCPDSMRCADWDYLDHILIRRTGGTGGRSADMEIARMLTPYGGAFSRDWQFEWRVDVTDFSFLLRDSIEIEYNHSGYEANHDRGWKLTLDFEIIRGRPAFEPIAIEKVYEGSFRYGDSTLSMDAQCKPFHFSRKKGAEWARFRIQQTGHGMNDSDGCGEFCSKWREVVFNGAVIDRKDLWMECSDNPLFPQAGTWIFDRANWCPGFLQPPDEYALLLQDHNTIAIQMEPYLAKGQNDARESLAAYVIQYRKNPYRADVALTAIRNPTDEQVFGRIANLQLPAQVEIQNLGSRPLQSLQFRYGTEGMPQKTYQWEGLLAPLEKAQIALPGKIEWGGASNVYVVEAHQPNGQADAWPDDNRMTAVFKSIPVHGSPVVVVLKTNREPWQTTWQITDESGAIRSECWFDSTATGVIRKDTLALLPGRYWLRLSDAGDDGLEFWFHRDGGSGYFRLQDTLGRLLKAFGSDFGRQLDYVFEISADTARYSPFPDDPSINLYPTLTKNSTALEYFHSTPQEVSVVITADDGVTVVEEHRYRNLKEGVLEFSLGYRPPQRYYFKLYIGDRLIFNKRIRVVP